jgi:hypothetical protein
MRARTAKDVGSRKENEVSKKERKMQAEQVAQGQIASVPEVADDEIAKLLEQARKQKEYHIKYNAEHREQIRAYHKEYNASNKKELTEEQKAAQKAYHMKYNQEHKEQVKAYHKAYNEARKLALAEAKAATAAAAKTAEAIDEDAGNVQ